VEDAPNRLHQPKRLHKASEDFVKRKPGIEGADPAPQEVAANHFDRRCRAALERCEEAPRAVRKSVQRDSWSGVALRASDAPM
jgi:hypothetical protein